MLTAHLPSTRWEEPRVPRRPPPRRALRRAATRRRREILQFAGAFVVAVVLHTL